jgi:hypothetical protein
MVRVAIRFLDEQAHRASGDGPFWPSIACLDRRPVAASLDSSAGRNDEMSRVARSEVCVYDPGRAVGARRGDHGPEDRHVGWSAQRDLRSYSIIYPSGEKCKMDRSERSGSSLR